MVPERGATEPRLKLLARAGKLGQGSAVIAGLRYAIEHRYDAVVTMDADFSHDPRYLSDMLSAVLMPGDAGVDVMIGSRYVAGGGVEGWPLLRRLMSRGVNMYARLALRLRTRDCSGGMRAYRAAKLAQLDFDQLVSTGYSFHEEMLWRLKRLECRLGETPITFVNRVKGKSKINAREAWRAVWVIFRLGLREHFGAGRVRGFRRTGTGPIIETRGRSVIGPVPVCLPVCLLGAGKVQRSLA